MNKLILRIFAVAMAFGISLSAVCMGIGATFKDNDFSADITLPEENIPETDLPEEEPGSPEAPGHDSPEETPETEKSPAPDKETEDFARYFAMLTPEHQQQIRSAMAELIKEQLQG